MAFCNLHRHTASVSISSCPPPCWVWKAWEIYQRSVHCRSSDPPWLSLRGLEACQLTTYTLVYSAGFIYLFLSLCVSVSFLFYSSIQRNSVPKPTELPHCKLPTLVATYWGMKPNKWLIWSALHMHNTYMVLCTGPKTIERKRWFTPILMNGRHCNAQYAGIVPPPKWKSQSFIDNVIASLQQALDAPVPIETWGWTSRCACTGISTLELRMCIGWSRLKKKLFKCYLSIRNNIHGQFISDFVADLKNAI